MEIKNSHAATGLKPSNAPHHAFASKSTEKVLGTLCAASNSKRSRPRLALPTSHSLGGMFCPSSELLQQPTPQHPIPMSLPGGNCTSEYMQHIFCETSQMPRSSE